MAIKMSCPACGKALNVPDSMAGKRAKCPACGGLLSLPAAPAAPEPAPEPESEPAPSPTPAKSPARATARPLGSGRAAGARRSRLPSAKARDTEAPAEPKAPLWRRLMWVGAIPFILIMGWIVVSLDEKHEADMAAICRGQAEQTFAAGAKDPGLVRFLVGEFHDDCLAAARVQERVTRRSQRWTYDVDKYMAAMGQRIERELASPNSERIKQYRAQGGGR